LGLFDGRGRAGNDHFAGLQFARRDLRGGGGDHGIGMIGQTGFLQQRSLRVGDFLFVFQAQFAARIPGSAAGDPLQDGSDHREARKRRQDSQQERGTARRRLGHRIGHEKKECEERRETSWCR
jgi:hypothetical protein